MMPTLRHVCVRTRVESRSIDALLQPVNASGWRTPVAAHLPPFLSCMLMKTHIAMQAQILDTINTAARILAIAPPLTAGFHGHGHREEWRERPQDARRVRSAARDRGRSRHSSSPSLSPSPTTVAQSAAVQTSDSATTTACTAVASTAQPARGITC
jgi:hypothetical protein